MATTRGRGLDVQTIRKPRLDLLDRGAPGIERLAAVVEVDHL